jgi:hypothetical protein
MGLDACVFCDCFERGVLRSPPLEEWRVYVERGGFLASATEDLDAQLAFDRWYEDSACVHPSGHLVSERIGNIALVSLLRGELEQEAERYPMLLNRVLYSGTHCGDCISADEVGGMLPEISALAQLHSPDPRHDTFLRDFEGQMRRLVEASLRVRKPLSF